MGLTDYGGGGGEIGGFTVYSMIVCNAAAHDTHICVYIHIYIYHIPNLT